LEALLFRGSVENFVFPKTLKQLKHSRKTLKKAPIRYVEELEP